MFSSLFLFLDFFFLIPYRRCARPFNIDDIYLRRLIRRHCLVSLLLFFWRCIPRVTGEIGSNMLGLVSVCHSFDYCSDALLWQTSNFFRVVDCCLIKSVGMTLNARQSILVAIHCE